MQTIKKIAIILLVILMNECVFCKIMNGSIPSYTIYEDAIVKVFLDINPNSLGHTLIVPKKHISDFTTIDDETLLHINKIAKQISNTLYEKLKCDGISLITNHGICQEVKHYHLHLIPRYKEDKDSISFEELVNILTK